ncbi:Uncharacterized protein ChrSV_4850 [Chromobacterium vaccinii]|nr:Uncharacterized protein ChrSW_4844 [Chromobacterium vaccinii]QND92305.1 Uncharacterized protein ChrSV_4850 [Chromobacterium vaccinii]
MLAGAARAGFFYARHKRLAAAFRWGYNAYCAPHKLERAMNHPA